MTTHSISPHLVFRSALGTATGFGIGLGVFSALAIALDAIFHIASFNLWLIVGAMTYALAGSVGGAALGIAIKRRDRLVWLALAGAIGLGGGFLVISRVHSFLIETRPIDQATSLLATVILFALLGAWTAVLLEGTLRRNAPRLGLAFLAGAFGFGLAALIEALGGAMLGQTQVLNYVAPRVLVLGIQGAISGAIGGAFLGAAVGT